jgi:Spy/CpxP family protein refolding chaperone
MKYLRTMVLLAGGTLALAGSAQQTAPAQGEEHGQRAGHAMPSVDDQMAAMTEQLNLTADQQAKIKPLLQDQHDQMQGLMRDQSMSQDDRRAKARSVHQSTVAKIRDILNDDQKKKYDAWQQEMREKMRQHQEGGEPPK